MIGAPVCGAGLVATRRWVRSLGLLVFGGLHLAFLLGFRPAAPTVEVLAPIEIEVIPKGDAVVESIASEAVVAAVLPTEPTTERATEAPPDDPAPTPVVEAPAPIAAPGPGDVPRVAPPAPQPEPRPVRERRHVEHPPKRRPAAEPKHEAARTSTPAPASAEIRTAGAVDGQEALRAARAGYGALVSAEINRHKHYPAAARERGEIGSVVVTFVVGPTGAIVAHALRRSSGSSALDAAAEAMLEASRAPPPPGGRFNGVIDIVFVGER